MTMQMPHAQPQRRTLWSWLRDTVLPLDRDGADLVPRAAAGTAGACAHAAAPRPAPVATRSGIILPFPIHGEALLVKLAETLRGRIGGRGPQHNPLELTISRDPRSRLSIDRAAYVEFRNDRSTYHAVIEAAADTTVMLETTDFDTLVRFVMQYVTERLSEPATLEAAS